MHDAPPGIVTWWVLIYDKTFRIVTWWVHIHDKTFQIEWKHEKFIHEKAFYLVGLHHMVIASKTFYLELLHDELIHDKTVYGDVCLMITCPWPHKFTWCLIIEMRHWFNSFTPGRCGYNLKLVILLLKPRIDILSISCEIILEWMPQDLTDDKSTMVQSMAWFRQPLSVSVLT